MKPTALIVVFAALALPAGAIAQTAPLPPPPSPWGGPSVAPVAVAAPSDTATARLRRLDSVLTWHADNERSRRLAVTITGAVVGAVGLGLGLGLASRDSSSDQVAGVFAGSIGIGCLLGVGIGALLPHVWDRVLEPLREGQQRRERPEAIVARTESLWREVADRNRRARRVASVTLTVVGGATLLAGSVFLLATPRRRSEVSTYRASGITLLGTGALTGVLGASLLFTADPLEQSWEVYERASGPITFGVAPLQDGAVAALGGTF